MPAALRGVSISSTASMSEKIEYDINDLTVEHLMPQSWNQHWPLGGTTAAERRLRCIALSRETVKRALRAEPDLAWRVLEVLAGRIRG